MTGASGEPSGIGRPLVIVTGLADAVADGDRVLALIGGNATNQDGRSGGLTVPNGPAQEAVIRAALSQAGVGPADIDYVEAHGTGTSLGDPIEVRALAGALGPGRAADAPLLVGVRLDLAEAGDTPPAVLRGLVRPVTRRAARTRPGATGAWADALACNGPSTYEPRVEPDHYAYMYRNFSQNLKVIG